MKYVIEKRGNRYDDVPGAPANSEYSHVIFSKAELTNFYRQAAQAQSEKLKPLNDEITRLKAELSQTREKNRQEISAAQAAVAAKISEADQRITAAEQAAAAAEKRAEIAENLNKNLIRIMKERANSSREVRPKKQRSGYLLIDTGHASYKYKVQEPMTRYNPRAKKVEVVEGQTREVQHELPCYRSIYESPALADLPEDQAFSIVEGAWKDGLWFDSRESYWQNTAGTIPTEEDNGTQLIFDWQMKPDYNRNVWRITVWHTLPLEPIDENLKNFSRK